MNISILAFRILAIVGTAIVLALSVGWGWQWVTSQAHRVEIARLEQALATVEADREHCEQQRLNLVREVDQIRAELEILAQDSQRRLNTANVIIEKSEAQRAIYERQLQQLRQSWPDDALEAVALVREELQL